MIRVTRTARDSGDRLSALPALQFARTTALQHSVMVDPAVKYQEIEGFGGAFTEAAADTFRRMPAAAKKEILTAYFDPAKGHGYTVGRTHINSCDFGLGSYAYDMVDGDVALKHFSIERDQKALIPLILAAQKAAGGKIKLFASPWSPPPWMKSNGDMCHGGKFKPEYRKVWCQYYIRYLKAYQEAGVDIWGMTVQNEPEANQPFDSCLWTGEEERDFVRDHLGPALQKNGFGHIRLMVWDHNRDRMYERAKAVYDDPAAAKYVWGTAYHWYEGECFDNVQRVHDAWPDKKLLFTEGCVRRGPPGGQWEDGERYGRAHHQRPEPLGRRLDRLEPAAGLGRRSAQRPRPLLQPDPGRCRLRQARLPAGVLVHGALLAVHPAGCAADHCRLDAERTGGHGLPEPRQDGGRGGPQPVEGGDSVRPEVRQGRRRHRGPAALDHDVLLRRASRSLCALRN